MYPLKLKYHAKTALWGGDTLKRQWGKSCDFEKLAETWELTVRPEASNIIENGTLAGTSLGTYVASNPLSVTDGGVGKFFPLLIKFIDARDDLSVQVHPDDTYAHEVENDQGKTEMWYIVDADEGAEIIYGLREGASSEDFKTAFEEGHIFDAMRSVKVKAGESYFIPSGMIHAIGRGCLIAEIQQNSDLTYRVYDYDRVGADGKPRELHTKKALDVIRPFTKGEIDGIRYSRKSTLNAGECLAACPYFEVHRLALTDALTTLSATTKSFHHLLCVGGEGEILCGEGRYPIARGDSYFLPAGMGEYSLFGNATLLISKI